VTATLYRCKAPGDYLCGCGRVARRLRRAGIEYEEERVAFRKADREEIEAMTGQLYVPVLVIGDEVIHESHRIVEHIDWLTREGAA
jgi:glutathione S-transferase